MSNIDWRSVLRELLQSVLKSGVAAFAFVAGSVGKGSPCPSLTCPASPPCPAVTCGSNTCAVCPPCQAVDIGLLVELARPPPTQLWPSIAVSLVAAAIGFIVGYFIRRDTAPAATPAPTAEIAFDSAYPTGGVIGDGAAW